MHNFYFKISSFLLVILVAAAGVIFAGQSQQQPQQQNQPASQQTQAAPASDSSAANQIIDKITARESVLAARMRTLHPLVETYLQTLEKDDAVAFRPTGDKYFLSKLDLNAPDKEQTMMKKEGLTGKLLGKVTQIYSVKYLSSGFAQMILVGSNFDRKNYDFEYVRREFLGDVRTVVFDVQPKKGAKGTFKGRIWAEDQDFTIVRFNGTLGSSTATKMFFHFDSWREYMANGEWLPAYVYTEESGMTYLMGARKLRFKGQTRLWAYNVGKANAQNELTSLIVESNQVNDTVDEADAISPVRSQRAWERDAEDNIIHRLQKAGLMAPDGEVNKVVETVATNLQITNNLDIQPEVRARILLTSPLESFTIGNTIVLSRGLIDVLPDEASLAMIVAHELAHIALGHQIDTKYAFNDRLLFDDPDAFRKIQLKWDEKEEIEADKKAAELLKNSPYKDKLGNAGLFLKAVDERAGQLPNLLLPHIGNTMVKGSQVQRMVDLKQAAPKLEMGKIDQIAALPLGGRVRIDPWNNNIELLKAKAVPLVAAREKMPFEITPVHLYLSRQIGSPEAAKAATGTKAPPDKSNQSSAVKQ
jgi:Peptidase family M48